MLRLLPFLLALVALSGCKTVSGNSRIEKREEIDRVAARILDDLYAESPSARAQVENAAGYGVFTNDSTEAFVPSAGNGFGYVTPKGTPRRTYMRAAELGAGFGLGVGDFSAIFVFETEPVLERFVNDGWNFGVSADAAATLEGEDAEPSEGLAVAPGIRVYQLTDSGLARSATLTGTRYWIDPDLN